MYYTTTTQNLNARTTTAAASDGTSTVTSTDGLSSTARDPRGNVTTTTKDTWGRVVSVTPPAGPGVTYMYDEMDRLIYVFRGEATARDACKSNPANCPVSMTTALTYDKAGRKTSMSDPDMGNWTYDYDALGNLTIQTDARNCTTNLTYDPLSRLTHKGFSNCPSTPVIDYYYDGMGFSFDGQDYASATNQNGYRTGMKVNGSNAALWTYDPRGRVTGEQRLFGEIVFGATAHAF